MYQIEEEELLFAIVLKLKRSEKNASIPPPGLKIAVWVFYYCCCGAVGTGS